MFTRFKNLTRKKKVTVLTVLFLAILSASYVSFRLSNNLNVIAMEAKLKERGANFHRKYIGSSFIKPFALESEGTFFESLFRSCYETEGFELTGAMIDDDLWEQVAKTDYSIIHLDNIKISERNLKEILKCSKLKLLGIVNFDISDKHILLLSKNNALEILNFRDTKITDKSITSIVSCKKLMIINLANTLVTDKCLIDLSKQDKLKGLQLSGNDITDAGILLLKPKSNIEFLILGKTSITDKSLAHISIMKNMKGLDFSETNVSDHGVKDLSKLKFIEDLILDKTAITDKCLPYLIRMKSLKHLDIAETKISVKGFKKLKKALPNCKIEYKALAQNPLTKLLKKEKGKKKSSP